MSEEERYINAIKKLDEEKRGVYSSLVIGILREIKRMKEEGFDEENKEVLLKVAMLKEVLGI